MPLPLRTRGVKVLKAVSSPLRLQVLNLLFDKGGLSYTELMIALKMNPSRDAGKFAYHLKFLLKAALVEADVETKKYLLTELGKMVIDVADRVEKKALKPKGMLVRTSHSTLEEFEASKIANSLVKEAKMPTDLAQKTAKDAEKLLRKSKIKYLTAPLVREVVNAILIEKGLEDYRHRLTRLGMPVHEVAALMATKAESHGSTSILAKAGKSVLGEYTLLNAFPRDISDAHVSGAIHVEDLGTWLLKPTEIMHDLRFFLQNGLVSISPFQHAGVPPQDFESALSTLFGALLHSSSEINKMQTCPSFNIFLAPFAKGQDAQRLKELLRLFVLSVNQHVEATIGLNPTIPEHVVDKRAVQPKGRIDANYADFQDESRLLALLTLEVVHEESRSKPLLNPRIIVKVNSETLKNETYRPIILRAHEAAGEGSAIYFHNNFQKDAKLVAFSGMGSRYQNELTGDWETDTLRTGCLGIVHINLPRITQESEKDKAKYIGILKERYELAARALEIKQRAFRQHGKDYLPFLSQSANGDTYFRPDNCLRIINLVGLKESVAGLFQNPIQNPESIKFVEEITQVIASSRGKTGKKLGKRQFTAILLCNSASERMAQLDIEKYGLAKVVFSGNRERPFYSTVSRTKPEINDQLCISQDSLELHQKLTSFGAGGNLNIIELEGTDYKPEELISLTSQLFDKQIAEFLTYNQRISYCSNCRKGYLGLLCKCPSCGAISSLTVFDRFG